MINAWWLLLIVPVAVFFGFMICALLSMSKEEIT